MNAQPRYAVEGGKLLELGAGFKLWAGDKLG